MPTSRLQLPVPRRLPWVLRREGCFHRPVAAATESVVFLGHHSRPVKSTPLGRGEVPRFGARSRRRLLAVWERPTGWEVRLPERTRPLLPVGWGSPSSLPSGPRVPVPLGSRIPPLFSSRGCQLQLCSCCAIGPGTRGSQTQLAVPDASAGSRYPTHRPRPAPRLTPPWASASPDRNLTEMR